MADLFFVAQRRTLQEFLEVYEPARAGDVDPTGSTLLHAALRNKPGQRGPISERLLDDGADAAVVARSGATTAHVLLGNARLDVEADAAILQRLLEGGCDPNRALERFGPPLFTLARALQRSDAALAPLYDVLLARPDLDPLAPVGPGRTLLDAVRALGDARADLTRRLVALLESRGVPVPTTEDPR